MDLGSIEIILYHTDNYCITWKQSDNSYQTYETLTENKVKPIGKNYKRWNAAIAFYNKLTKNP